MTKQENKFIYEVLNLMIQCPQASPNPYELVGWIHAAKDYQKIHHLVYSCLNNYTTYSTWKSKLGSDEIDDDWILSCKERYEESFEELKCFITKRTEEGWE